MNNKMKYMYLLPAAVLVVAVIFGGMGACSVSLSDKEAVTQYMGTFFEQVSMGDGTLLVNSLKKNIMLWLLITISGTFMPFCLINVLILVERGFVIGYTSACFFSIYGNCGFFPCISLIPEMVIFVPVLIYFSSISLKMSFFRRENKKSFLKKYVFVSIFCLSVFCVVSFFQTFLTTIFMSIAANAA